MYCTKCGKEIPDGEKKVCDECETNIDDVIVTKAKKAENKAENASKKYGDWNVSKEKSNNSLVNKIIICAFVILFIVAIILVISNLVVNNRAGNTIGNIRNYGYAVEADNWIYYLAPNEDSSQIGIFKIKNNGKDNKLVYMTEMDIVSLNVYKDYIYFIGSATETYLDDDVVDNKIYRMKIDGTNLEILNDNEVNNDCYEIYVVNDQIYYIGLNAEIFKMDLNGANKTVVADNGTGFLGITKDYIIYNADSKNEDEYVTYIMNIDGTDAKPIIEGKRLYSVNIEGKYIYYGDADKKIYKTEIGTGIEEILYENIDAYNLNTNEGYAYYLNYLDPENSNYTVCLFRVKLDGSSEKPEKLKELETYSSFIDVVGDWVIYMDSSDEAGFINLVNKNGKNKEIELYRLDYNAFYDNLDYSEVTGDSTEDEVENTVVEDSTNTISTENDV